MMLGAKVYPHNTLHAKMAIAGGFAFVGSSNASSNGLGQQGDLAKGREELNVIFFHDDVIAKLNEQFTRLREGAGPQLVTNDPRLEIAKRRWVYRQTHQPMDSDASNLSLLESLQQYPEIFKGGSLQIVVSSEVLEDELKEFEAAEIEVTEKFGSDFSLYLNWDKLPFDALLMDFTVDSAGAATFNGFWKRDPAPDETPRSRYQRCRKYPTALGYSVSKREAKAWERLVTRYWNDAGDGEAVVDDISGFAKKIFL